MKPHPIFLSIVLVVRNEAASLISFIKSAENAVSSLVSDYELIIVDNASEDDSILVLKELTGQKCYPNLQVFALTKEVDADTASWAGVENALGDFVAVVDPVTDDVAFLETMLDHAVAGSDVVFAENKQKRPQSFPYRICSSMFNMLYMAFNGMRLGSEAPRYRILSKRVVNFILQHSLPAIAYRHLPATGGFSRKNMNYTAAPSQLRKKRLMESIDRGLCLLMSTTNAPLRLVTTLSLFGAVVNLIYSAYVIVIAFSQTNVAPGWVTLSLQQSGMFFLISLVLLVLGEHMLHMANLSNQKPLYHVAQEFTSTVMIRRQKLNIEETDAATPKPKAVAPSVAEQVA
jgi:hypothetical protein